MPSLAHELHLLVSLMDHAADGLLARHGVGLSYRRFIVLLHVSDADGPTQRDLAERLGSSEGATSRMVAGLVRDGLVDAARGPGNSRQLRLTPLGGERLATAGAVLGDRFDVLVRTQGVDPADLTTTVRRLSAALREG